MSDQPELPEAVEMPVEDVLDLHSFPPREVKGLVLHYLDLAAQAGFTRIRIVHGKGKGVQRELVRTLLERDPRIDAFGDADGGGGGWGATWASFRARPKSETP